MAVRRGEQPFSRYKARQRLTHAALQFDVVMVGVV